MNKKNLSISISLFITSLFFTFIFYFAYKNMTDNYKSFRERSFYDARIEGFVTSEDMERIKKLDNIKQVGLVEAKNYSANLDGEILVLNYADQGYFQMIEASNLLSGDFPKKENEITIPEKLSKEKNLKVNDRINVDLGERIVDGKEIKPVSTLTKNEKFKKESSSEYVISGITKNIYNENMKINYTLRPLDKKTDSIGLIIFDDFLKAYENKESLEKEISKEIGKKSVKIEFNNNAINYFGADMTKAKRLMSKSINVFSLLGTIILFVFFTKNIFTVWALRKIKELSMYKSIGSTDFQIYRLLFKEGIKISVIPVVIGHILGFSILNLVFYKVQDIQEIEVSAREFINFQPILSIAILLVTFLIISLALFSPAKKLANINIIDGIRGDFKGKDKKLKRHKDFWKELRANNLKSILSQRYISAIGMIIVSVFLIVLSMSKYYRNVSYYDYKSNVEATIYSKDEKVPEVLYKLNEGIKNKRSSISSSKYIAIKYREDFSDDFKKIKLDKKIKEYYDQDDDIYLDGLVTALDDETFKYIGGEKGQILLLNKTQKDPRTPISEAEYIKYFKNLKNIDYSPTGEKTFNHKLKIDKEINSLKGYRQKIMPFELNFFVDYDTYFSLLEEWNKEYIKDSHTKFRNNYQLRMTVDDKDLENVKDLVKKELDSNISYNETYNCIFGDEIKESQATDIKSFTFMILAIGLIIFILNLTNGFAAINLSLLTRKREIGALTSVGLERKELKNRFLKDFILEQIKSMSLVILLSILLMFVVSILSQTIDLKILLEWFEYKYFVIFAFLVYGFNILIYRKSLDNILNNSVVELIKNE